MLQLYMHLASSRLARHAIQPIQPIQLYSYTRYTAYSAIQPPSGSPAESPESPLRPIGGELLQASARSLRVRVVHLPAWVLVSGPGRRRVVIVGSSKGLVAQEPVCFVEPRRYSSAAVSLGLRSGWTRLAGNRAGFGNGRVTLMEFGVLCPQNVRRQPGRETSAIGKSCPPEECVAPGDATMRRQQTTHARQMKAVAIQNA